MVEILQETSVIPKDANYTLKEINEILDIVISITEKNKSLLRNEEALYKLALLLKDKNIKEDSIELKKLLKIIEKNIVYMEGRDLSRFQKFYFKTAEILEKKKFVKSYVSIVINIITKLRTNRLYGETHRKICVEFCENLLEKHKLETNDDFVSLYAIMGNTLFLCKEMDLSIKASKKGASFKRGMGCLGMLIHRYIYNIPNKELTLKYLKELKKKDEINSFSNYLFMKNKAEKKFNIIIKHE